MFRIVSYNVLSSHLSTSSIFPLNNPNDLKPPNRLIKLKEILKGYIFNSFIILLQEVTINWTEELYVFFSKFNYTLITSNYGNVTTGHMGVAIAFPSIYNLEKVVNRPITSSLAWAPLKSEGDWSNVKYNTKRWLGLYLQLESYSFWIVTCHLPCVYTNPYLTNTYVYSFLHSVNSIVGDSPVIIGGDFNFKSTDDAHMTMSTGNLSTQSLDKNDYSPTNWPMAKTKGLKRVPITEFTCYSCIKWGDGVPEPFKGTIDHIYYRNIEYVSKENIDQPDEYLPSSLYPSDHLPIVACFDYIK